MLESLRRKGNLSCQKEGLALTHAYAFTARVAVAQVADYHVEATTGVETWRMKERLPL
jgi:hypothetical protein